MESYWPYDLFAGNTTALDISDEGKDAILRRDIMACLVRGSGPDYRRVVTCCGTWADDATLLTVSGTFYEGREFTIDEMWLLAPDGVTIYAHGRIAGPVRGCEKCLVITMTFRVTNDEELAGPRPAEIERFGRIEVSRN